MALRKPFDERAATHRVITRQPSGVADNDETGWITVENRVVDAVTSLGTAVHLRLENGAASRLDPDGRLERVRGADRVLTGAGPEYRAPLPDDADVVRSVLAVDSAESDAWADRVFALEEFVVRTDAAWCYRSVPHHAHIRELHADGCDTLLQAVTDALESVPRSTVVPVDGLVTWQSNGDRYELSWDVLRRRERDADRDRWSAFELDRLRRVRPVPNREEVVLRWAPSAAETWPRRILRRLLDPESVAPPTRIAFPDRDAMHAAIDALGRLRESLEYSYAIDESESEQC
ncbi:hypothetical protein HTG_05790 [Natrinema mahii]|nr:hypothetical protein HTG_05790 [Natrinema mahii]